VHGERTFIFIDAEDCALRFHSPTRSNFTETPARTRLSKPDGGDGHGSYMKSCLNFVCARARRYRMVRLRIRLVKYRRG
jgi:hypothetical protein